MAGGTADPGGMTPEEIVHEVRLLDSDIAIENRLEQDDLADLMHSAFIPGIGRDTGPLLARRKRLYDELTARGLPIPEDQAADPKPPAGPGFDPVPPSASADPADAEDRQLLDDGPYEPPPADPPGAPGPLPSWLTWPRIAIAAAVALIVVLGVSALTAGAPGASPAPSAAPPSATVTAAPSAAASVGPSAPTSAAAATPCGPDGKSNGAEDVQVTGAVTAHVTDDCGYGGQFANVTHCTVQITPYDKTRNSYTYDMTGGFYAGGLHFNLSLPGSGIGPSYSHNLATQDQTTGMGHVTMLSAAGGISAAPASTWQSAKAGTMSWTPSTVTLSNVLLTAFPGSANPQGPVTISGTWKVYGCAGG